MTNVVAVFLTPKAGNFKMAILLPSFGLSCQGCKFDTGQRNRYVASELYTEILLAQLCHQNWEVQSYRRVTAYFTIQNIINKKKQKSTVLKVLNIRYIKAL